MLPRVAGALFDIGREIERMDQGARILEVVHGLGLGAAGRGGIAARMGEAAPSSMAGVAARAAVARTRADTVRGHLPAELWEAVNEAGLDLRDALETSAAANGVFGAALCARRAAHLVFGVADQAMRRDGLWHYLRLGRFLERAGATTRLLALAESADGDDGDERGWRAVLEAASAYHGFLRSRFPVLDHSSVVAFLVLDDDFPRSVVFALTEVSTALDALRDERALPPGGVAGELTADLLEKLAQGPPLEAGGLLAFTLRRMEMIEAAVAVDCLPRVLDDPGGLHDAQAAHQTQN
jgi:uncharacterized alpha-E superfamily protein